jgi:hypothetical protein
LVYLGAVVRAGAVGDGPWTAALLAFTYCMFLSLGSLNVRPHAERPAMLPAGVVLLLVHGVLGLAGAVAMIVESGHDYWRLPWGGPWSTLGLHLAFYGFFFGWLAPLPLLRWGRGGTALMVVTVLPVAVIVFLLLLAKLSWRAD